MTRQRQQIYETIMESPRHMTAEEVYDAVRVRMPGIARATVYRNLGLMERDGEVRRVHMADAPDRYDRMLVPHEHILCPRCGALEDFTLPGLAEQIAERIGRPVQALNVCVQALCSTCAHQEEIS
ncbi:MAG: Fur family transcriptional regulator [Candidatus Ventricola sp.]